MTARVPSKGQKVSVTLDDGKVVTGTLDGHSVIIDEMENVPDATYREVLRRMKDRPANRAIARAMKYKRRAKSVREEDL